MAFLITTKQNCLFNGATLYVYGAERPRQSPADEAKGFEKMKEAEKFGVG